MTVRVGTARGSFGANSNQFFGPLICSLIETNTLSGVNPSGKVGLRSFIAGHKRSGTRMAEPDKKLSLIEEQLVIDKRAVSDGRVRVSTKTEFVTEAAEARLDSENVEVTRVAIGREVSEAPGVRTDGDVTIVPVMEEVLVVEKRLMLVEEIHIRRVATTEDVSIPVELRKQRASIERDEP